jgi:hypothetical protein
MELPLILGFANNRRSSRYNSLVISDNYHTLFSNRMRKQPAEKLQSMMTYLVLLCTFPPTTQLDAVPKLKLKRPPQHPYTPC